MFGSAAPVAAVVRRTRRRSRRRFATDEQLSASDRHLVDGQAVEDRVRRGCTRGARRPARRRPRAGRPTRARTARQFDGGITQVLGARVEGGARTAARHGEGARTQEHSDFRPRPRRSSAARRPRRSGPTPNAAYPVAPPGRARSRPGDSANDVSLTASKLIVSGSSAEHLRGQRARTRGSRTRGRRSRRRDEDERARGTNGNRWYVRREELPLDRRGTRLCPPSPSPNAVSASDAAVADALTSVVMSSWAQLPLTVPADAVEEREPA